MLTTMTSSSSSSSQLFPNKMGTLWRGGERANERLLPNRKITARSYSCTTCVSAYVSMPRSGRDGKQRARQRKSVDKQNEKWEWKVNS